MRTLCAYYYSEDGHDSLILEAIRPFTTDGAFFLRHWRRGPHLRLVAPPDGSREAVEEFVRRHPSVSTLDPHAMLPTHQRLAEVEQEIGALWPWRPDNSVYFEPYDSRVHVLGSQEAADFIADFYRATNESAFTALERGQRLWTAFDLMAATVRTFANGGLPRGYVSFRAHAEVFLAQTGEADRWRAEWDRRYKLARPALVERLANHAAGCIPDSLARRGFQLVQAGKLRMAEAPSGVRPPDWASPFLRELITNKDFHEGLMPTVEFKCYRLLLNLLYLHLTRLGVRAVDRYLLCHLMANAVEDHYGVDAVSTLRSIARAAT